MAVIDSTRLREILGQIGVSGAETMLLGPIAYGHALGSPIEVVVKTGLEMSPVEVKYGLLHAMVQRLTGQIKLEETAKGLSLKSGRSKFTLPISKTVSVPPTEVVGEETELRMVELKNLLKYVEPFTEHGEGRAAWRYCILLTGRGQNMRAVGSDGTSCAFIGHPDKAGDYEVAIPSAGVRAIHSLKGEEVRLMAFPNKLVVVSGDVTLHLARVSGGFPDIDGAVPKSFGFEATVDGKEMLNALQAASIVLAEESDQHITLDFHDDTLHLAVTSKKQTGLEIIELLQYEQQLPDPFDSTPSVKFRVGHRYLLDFFGSVSGPVRFGVPDMANRPCALLTSGNKRLLLSTVYE